MHEHHCPTCDIRETRSGVECKCKYYLNIRGQVTEHDGWCCRVCTLIEMNLVES